MFAHALVYAFVAPRKQQQVRLRCQLVGNGLCELAALRAQQNHGRAGGAAQALDGREYWLGLQHHAAAAAVGHVVRDAVLVCGVVANVVQAHLQCAKLLCALEDAFIEICGAHLGKQGQDIDAHAGILPFSLRWTC